MCWKANSENLTMTLQGSLFFTLLFCGFCSDRFPTFPRFIKFYEYSNLQTNLPALFLEDEPLVWISHNCLNTINLVINTNSGMGFFWLLHPSVLNPALFLFMLTWCNLSRASFTVACCGAMPCQEVWRGKEYVPIVRPVFSSPIACLDWVPRLSFYIFCD